MPSLPDDDANELEWLLYRQSQVISRRQALRVAPAAMLRRNVAAGRWTSPHRGIYVAHNGPLTVAQRAWIGVLVANPAGRAPLAGISALTASGLRGYGADAVHVYVPASSRVVRPPSYVVVHRTRTLTRDDLHPGMPPRTAAARSVLDAARWAGDDHRARAIIAAAFQQRLVDAASMSAALGKLTRIRRRHLILATIHDAAGGSESITEQDFLRLCRRAGLPTPTCQTVLTDASGRRRYRDAYFAPWRLHIEVDGGQHMEVTAWWADMRRQNDMWIAGDRVLRFPAWAIRNDPDRVIATVRTALTAAGWRPAGLRGE